jgi:hypothetical protein
MQIFPSTTDSESGIWNQESGIWNLESGIWIKDSGISPKAFPYNKK